MIGTLSTLICACLSLAGMSGSAAVSDCRLDPSPYDMVRDSVEWISPAGRHLLFGLLGYHGERRARVVAVFEKDDGSWRRLFLDDDRGFEPWAIRLAELDGDSLPEIAVGVYKESRYDPVVRERIFIFDWTARDSLFPLWLGSRLAYPFSSFEFIRGADGRSRLLTTEGAHGRQITRIHRWNGFGFTFDSTLVGPARH